MGIKSPIENHHQMMERLLEEADGRVQRTENDAHITLEECRTLAISLAKRLSLTSADGFFGAGSIGHVNEVHDLAWTLANKATELKGTLLVRRSEQERLAAHRSAIDAETERLQRAVERGREGKAGQKPIEVAE